MTDVFKMSLCAILAFVLVYSFAFWYNQTGPGSSKAILEKGVAAHALPSVVYNGVLYEFASGELVTKADSVTEAVVLRLAHFALEARIAPRYALPGTDLEAMKASLDALRDSRLDMAEAYQIDGRDHTLQMIYPLDFLDSLRRSEDSRRALIASPSEETAESYHLAILRSMRMHQDFLVKYINRLEHPDPSQRDHPIRFSNGVTTTTYVQDVLRLYLQNADIEIQAAQDRWSCYQGDYSRCTEIAYPDVEVMGVKEVSVTDDVRDRIAVVESYNGRYQKERTSTQLTQLSRSQCALFAPVTYSHFWLESAAGNTIFRPYIIDDLYFNDTQSGKITENPFYQAYTARGGPRYELQPISNYYSCLDISSDLSLVSSIIALTEAPFPLVHEYADSEIAAEVVAVLSAHEALLESEVVTESEAAVYAAAIRELLEADQHTLSIEERLALESQLLAYVYRTAHFPQLINLLVHVNGAIPAFRYHGYNEDDLGYSLYMRVAPKLLLGGFTPGIMRQDLALVETVTEDISSKLAPYSEVRAFYPNDEFWDSFTTSLDVHEELLTEAGVSVARRRE